MAASHEAPEFMPIHKALIASVVNPSLARDLRGRVRRVADPESPLDPLEQLALKVGLVQGRAAPRFSTPSLVVFAADHGLAVDNISADEPRTTAATVHCLVTEQLPLASLCRGRGLSLMIVDSGIAEPTERHDLLHARKIAHGTRNSRLGTAMSMEQVQAAIRAGIEIGQSLDGNAVACSGIGVGSVHSAALVLSALSKVSPWEFIGEGAGVRADVHDHAVLVLERVRQRHIELTDPIEVLAAIGGFEVAMMVGLMLSAAARRFVILPDGLPACAALMVASAVAPGLADYCVHTRSNRLATLARALALFDANADVELDVDAIDGTGATLTWSLVSAAADLLSNAP